MMFIVGLPVAQIVLFCLSVGKDPYGLHLAVINHETTNKTCPPTVSCDLTQLSCQYLRQIELRRQVLVRTGLLYHDRPLRIHYVICSEFFFFLTIKITRILHRTGLFRRRRIRVASGQTGQSLGRPIFYDQLFDVAQRTHRRRTKCDGMGARRQHCNHMAWRIEWLLLLFYF